MSTSSKVKITGEALTPNKPYTALGYKQYYSKLKKVIILNPGMVKEDLTMLASTDKADLKNKDISRETTSKKVNKDKELNTLKVITLLTFKSTPNPNAAPKDNNTNKEGPKPLRT